MTALLTKAIDKRYHRQKEEWGRRFVDNQLLTAVRMLEVNREDAANLAYKHEQLFRRDLFYIHARTKTERNLKAEIPRVHIIEDDNRAYLFEEQ